MYLVPDNDEDLFADRSVTLKEVDQLEPQTHFGAMFARQITNNASPVDGQRNIAGGLVGDPTKMGVNAVSEFAFPFLAFSKFKLWRLLEVKQ